MQNWQLALLQCPKSWLAVEDFPQDWSPSYAVSPSYGGHALDGVALMAHCVGSSRYRSATSPTSTAGLVTRKPRPGGREHPLLRRAWPWPGAETARPPPPAVSAGWAARLPAQCRRTPLRLQDRGR